MAQFEVIILAHSEARIRVSGSLDVRSAEALGALRLRLRVGALVVDLSHARALDDAAFAALAETLFAQTRDLRILGLCAHHVRLLGYLNLAVDHLGRIGEMRAATVAPT